MAIIDMKLDLVDRPEDRISKEMRQSGFVKFKQLNKTFLRTSHHRMNRSMEKAPFQIFEE